MPGSRGRGKGGGQGTPAKAKGKPVSASLVTTDNRRFGGASLRQCVRSPLRPEGLHGGLDPLVIGPSGPGPAIALMETQTGSTTGTSLTLTFSTLTDASQCIPLLSVYNSATGTNFITNRQTNWIANVFDDAGTVKCLLTRQEDDATNSTFSFVVTLWQFDDAYEVNKYTATDSTNASATGYFDRTITAVNVGSAFVVGHCGYNAAGGNYGCASANWGPRILNATTVRHDCDFSNGPTRPYYFYTVSDPSGNMQVETLQVTESSTSTWTTKDLTTSALDATACLILGTGYLGTSNNYYGERASCSCEVVSASTIRFTRGLGYQPSANGHRFTVQVVSIPGVTVRHGIHAWTATQTSVGKTVSPAVSDLNKACALATQPSCMFNAMNNGPFDGASLMYAANGVRLTTVSNVQLDRGVGTGVDPGRIGYQVIEITG